MPNQISETVLGEAEKISLVALPGKLPAGSCIEIQSPNMGGITEEFLQQWLKTGVPVKIRVCAGPALFFFFFIYLFGRFGRSCVTWDILFRQMDSSCGAQASVFGAHGLSCSKTCGILVPQ